MGAHKHHPPVCSHTPHCHTTNAQIPNTPTKKTLTTMPTNIAKLPYPHTNYPQVQTTNTIPLTHSMPYTAILHTTLRSAPTNREHSTRALATNATHITPPKAHNSKSKKLHLPSKKHTLQQNSNTKTHTTYKLTFDKPPPPMPTSTRTASTSAPANPTHPHNAPTSTHSKNRTPQP